MRQVKESNNGFEVKTTKPNTILLVSILVIRGNTSWVWREKQYRRNTSTVYVGDKRSDESLSNHKGLNECSETIEVTSGVVVI